MSVPANPSIAQARMKPRATADPRVTRQDKKAAIAMPDQLTS